MSMLLAIFASVFLVISPGLSFPEKDVPNVNPEYLDMLLKTNQYELFSKLTRIDDVSLVRPHEGARSTHPMFNEGLKYGDILIPKEHIEEARQSVRFEVWGGSKWQNGYVPYIIFFNGEEKKAIENAINRWNEQVDCIKFYPRTKNEEDYVLFFNGSGCWSFLGRISGPQMLSLQSKSCMNQGTILHEMNHAVGMAHEHNRHDRDDYVKIRWSNIPEDWHPQYERINEDDWKIVGPYDFYSIMHYPLHAPGSLKTAIEIKSRGVDLSRVGQGQNLTAIDVDKLNKQYC